MKPWSKVTLKELLQRSDETAILNPEQDYHEITIRLWGKGIVSRGKVRGSDVVTSRRFVRANQLILSKIDARHGAIGLVPPALDGSIVSNDFPSFYIDASRIEPAFIGWLARSARFIDLCKASSEGTTNRVRIKEDLLLSQKIAFPPLSEQQAIIARLDAVAEKARQVEAKLDEIEADLTALLISIAHRSDLAESEKLKRGWRYVYIKEFIDPFFDQVSVDPDGSYPNVGIYSYSRGLFEKPPIEGSTTSAKTLFKIKSGLFIYSRLFAFEGAYGLVPKKFDDHYVSNEFPTFAVDEDQATPEFLFAYFKSPSIWSEVAMGSKGLGDRRQRVHPQQILEKKIWLPPLDYQKKISKVFARIEEKKSSLLEQKRAIQTLLPSMLEQIFN